MQINSKMKKVDNNPGGQSDSEDRNEQIFESVYEQFNIPIKKSSVEVSQSEEQPEYDNGDAIEEEADHEDEADDEKDGNDCQEREDDEKDDPDEPQSQSRSADNCREESDRISDQVEDVSQGEKSSRLESATTAADFQHKSLEDQGKQLEQLGDDGDDDQNQLLGLETSVMKKKLSSQVWDEEPLVNQPVHFKKESSYQNIDEEPFDKSGHSESNPATHQEANHVQSSRKVQNLRSQEKEKENALFYVSTSKNMYPNLDLKPKQKQVNENSKIQQQKLHSVFYPTKIKILDYRSEYFLKIQTQIFEIEVFQQGGEQSEETSYKIHRRFSDFIFLYESVFTNHLGYIIPPFPQKSMESFIKIKLSSFKVGSGKADQEKYEMIERRLAELERFVNFLIQHKQLRYCEQLGIFLVQDAELYAKGRQRIEKYVAEYSELETPSNVKKVIESGISMIKSWIGRKQINKSEGWEDQEKKKQQKLKQITKEIKNSEQNLKFDHYSEQIHLCHEKFKNLLSLINKFLKIQKTFSNFNDIDTDIDELLRLCSKLSSGKEYCRLLVQNLENQSQLQAQLYTKWFKQSESQLKKRNQIINIIIESQHSEECDKAKKLKRRIDRFDKNFESGYQDLIKSSKVAYGRCQGQFKKCWNAHCRKMGKIWQ